MPQILLVIESQANFTLRIYFWTDHFSPLLQKLPGQWEAYQCYVWDQQMLDALGDQTAGSTKQGW